MEDNMSSIEYNMLNAISSNTSTGTSSPATAATSSSAATITIPILLFVNEDKYTLHYLKMKRYCKNIKKSLDMYIDVQKVKFSFQLAFCIDWEKTRHPHRHVRRGKWVAFFQKMMGKYVSLDSEENVRVLKYRHFETELCDKIVNGRVQFGYTILSDHIQSQKLNPQLEIIFSPALFSQNGTLLKKVAVFTENNNFFNLSPPAAAPSTLSLAAMNGLTVIQNFKDEVGTGTIDNLSLACLKLSLTAVKDYKKTYSVLPPAAAAAAAASPPVIPPSTVTPPDRMMHEPTPSIIPPNT